ncbi:MAG TPA: RIP metalloprotease RseP [Patescibacteria group bacterium]|nr:RIP metalloprotease RseP [Patescibacteria group bacterium]
MEMLNKLLSTPFDFIKDYGGPFIFVLAVLVFIHEWGHYIIARLCGVKIEKFSIGFGREIWGRNDKHGTRWKICMIPLGGYVQMFGDSDPSSAGHAEGVKEGDTVRSYTEQEKKVAFYTQPLWKRAAIVFAGPAINYIFAIFVLSALFMTQGQPYMPPVAAKVVEPSAAFDAGIRPDDKIVSINGEEITRFQDLRPITDMNIGKEMEVKIVHSLGPEKGWDDANPVMLKITPRKIVKEDRFGFRHEVGMMGIVSPESAFEMQKHGFFSSIFAALGETWRITTMTLKALGQMIIGTRSTDELGGILRIGAYAGDFASQGIIAFITFAALLSINLGLINLLPIPLLDGGHLAMYAMEMVRGKPLSMQVQEYALRVGLVFLLGIMFLATWNDLVQLKVVDYVVKLIS